MNERGRIQRPGLSRRTLLAGSALAGTAALLGRAGIAQAACGADPSRTTGRPEKAVSLRQVSEELAAGRPVRLENLAHRLGPRRLGLWRRHRGRPGGLRHLLRRLHHASDGRLVRRRPRRRRRLFGRRPRRRGLRVVRVHEPDALLQLVDLGLQQACAGVVALCNPHRLHFLPHVEGLLQAFPLGLAGLGESRHRAQRKHRRRQHQGADSPGAQSPRPASQSLIAHENLCPVVNFRASAARWQALPAARTQDHRCGIYTRVPVP